VQIAELRAVVPTLLVCVNFVKCVKGIDVAFLQYNFSIISECCVIECGL
jgi:hypothetical protein